MDQIITNMCSFSDNKDEAGSYRLGDHILGYDGKMTYDKDYYILKDPKYKDTILGKFVTKISEIEGRVYDKHTRYKIAAQIVKEMMQNKKFDIPEPTDLVIHIRLGDVFDLPPDKEYLIDKKPNFDKIKRIIRNNKKKNRIVFVTAISFGAGEFSEKDRVENGTKKSKEFMQNVLDLIPEDMSYKIHSTKNVDQDFIYLVNAKKLFLTSKSCFLEAAFMVNKLIKY